jgi:hypothetical protein
MLTPGNHSLALTLMSNTTAIFLDGMSIVSKSPAETKGKLDHTPEIVGGTIGGVVSVLLLLVLFLLYRRKRRNTGQSHVLLRFTLVSFLFKVKDPYALGPLQASLPTSKEAFTSPKYSHYGISFTHSVTSSAETLTPLP